MNKKIRKLFRDPKRFFLDSKVGPLLSRIAPPRPTSDNAVIGKARLDAPLGIAVPGLDAFDLVGENWLRGEPKPLAVLWGFHPWKRGFVSEYLQEYRVAYARGRTPWLVQRSALAQQDVACFIVWGMTEPEEVRQYAQHNQIPIYRMEDGFIRSAELGSKHTTALSLVLDKEGIYFDASAPSSLERLLNEYDFAHAHELMDAARALLQIVRDLRVSKYNLSAVSSVATLLGPKLRRRILVIGQVESDASIKYGGAEGWTNERLIQLAVDENPGAEVIYRPHPDVVAGFRSDSSVVERLRTKCRVLTEDVILGELFDAVDRVYTITSLSGFEAVIHGVPVTVVGAPFYCGWGLTDDRCKVERRKRTLSVEELFCATYLLYPRYLPNLEDAVTGCLAAILRVVAERRQHLHSSLNAKVVAKRPTSISTSEYWPVLLRAEHKPGLQAKYGKKLLSLLSPQAIFSRCSGQHYKCAIAYLLVGALGDSQVYPRLLTEIRTALRRHDLAQLLSDLWKIKPSAVLVEHWAWYCEQIGDRRAAEEWLRLLAFNHTRATNNALKPRYEYVLKLAQLKLRQRSLDEARILFLQHLLSGTVNAEVLTGLAEIARLQFDFVSAAAILQINNAIDPIWRQGRAWLQGSQAYGYCGMPVRALDSIAFASFLNPTSTESIGSIEEGLRREIGDLPYREALVAMTEIGAAVNQIGRARALIGSKRYREAEDALGKYSPKASELVQYCLTLSMAYSYQGKVSEAKALVESLLPLYPTLAMYREGLRISVVKNDYVWGKQLLAEAVSRDLEVGDIYHRKIALGCRDIRGSYLSFRAMSATRTLTSYLGERYVQSLDHLPNELHARVLILAFFGPGDEIRFASLYRAMRRRSPTVQLSFTCDPRLYSLLERSYPELRFIPTGRIRSLNWLSDFSAFKGLPGSDLHTFFDNKGWAAVQEADKVILTTDALGDVIENYDSFPGERYFVADTSKVRYWSERLAPWAEQKLVGLSWRSSLTTYSRNEHYLSIDQLVPIFESSDITFVNLQYDDCAEELKWIDERYPGRLIHFPELDQYNDLDGVAALMSCLDLIVSPATTVVELAGALGRPTLLLSNSSELHWRKLADGRTDVWHRSISHVEGEVLGDKESLVQALAMELAERFSAFERRTVRASEIHPALSVA